MQKYQYDIIINCHVGIDCTKANKTYFLWVTHHGTQKIMQKYQYDIIINCHVGIDCTKANKTYFLWVTQQWHKEHYAKIPKFEDYLPISMDNNMDNAVQLQS